MIDVVQQSLFELVQETHQLLDEFEGLAKRTVEVAIKVGHNLIRLRDELPHGEFLPTLQSEFGLGQATAYNFIHLAETENKFTLNVSLPLYIRTALASPTMPQKVIEQVESGQTPPTLPAIREAKHEAQATNHGCGISELYSRSQGSPTLYTIPVDESGEEKDYQWLYNPETHEAYCKYCYKTHRLWEHFHDVFPGEHVWECQVCQHRTKDEYMQIEGDGIILPPVETDRMSHDDYPLPVVNRGVPAALQSSDSNEWYTPAQYVDAARELMGGIDIDPASCDFANKIVQAKNFYAKNGLTQSWGKRVWLNPPYGFDGGRSNQELWSSELIQRYEAGLVTEAILLVNANTEAKWFQPLYEYFICFTDHRIRFYNTSGESSQPTQGNALVYFGKDKKQQNRFIEIFSRFGVVVRRADGR